MAERLLEKIRREIRERLRAAETAVREHEHFEAALEALGGPVVDTPRPGRRPVPPEDFPAKRHEKCRAADQRRALRARRSASIEQLLTPVNARPSPRPR